MNIFPKNKSWNKHLHVLSILYPNRSSGGFYSLALHLLYNITKNNENWYPELNFLDNSNLKDFIAITIQHELDLENIKEILKNNNIPLTKDRSQIIFAGGPCIHTNPKPFEEFIDFFVLAPVEITLPKLLKAKETTKTKEEFLNKIKDIKGIYIPNVTKQEIIQPTNLDKYPYPLEQPFPERGDFIFGKTFILEIERGCPFNCKFCSISSIYKKTYYRSLNNIKEIIDKGIEINKRDKVMIYSASFTHPDRKEILKYLIKKNLKFSVPSIKAEIMDYETLSLIKQGGQRTLTIAPESSERLRKTLNKNLTDEQILNFVEMANKLKFETIKLYFMINLPNQTQEDLQEIVKLTTKIKKAFNGKTHLSINPYISKPKTNLKQNFNKKEIKKQINYLKKNLNVKFITTNLTLAEKEFKIANS